MIFRALCTYRNAADAALSPISHALACTAYLDRQVELSSIAATFRSGFYSPYVDRSIRMNPLRIFVRRNAPLSAYRERFSCLFVLTASVLAISAASAQSRPCPPATSGVVGGQSGTSTCAPSSADILFAMDYSAAAAPNAGWPSSTPESATWRRTRLEGGGPNGQNAYRITEQYANVAMNGGDFYYGWGAANLLALQPLGQSRFYRIRWKFSANTNFNARDQTDGTAGAIHRNKLIIIGDGTSIRNARVIPAFQGMPATRSWNLVIGKDGGDDQVTSRDYTTLGVWHDMQFEVRYSTASGVADGYYKVWIDSNNYAAPTLQRVGIVVNRPNSNALTFGYMNNGIASGSTYEFEHADFQIASSFDGAWDR